MAETGPFKLGGLSVKELSKRVWREITDDNVFDAAAALAYYFLLALFPLLIFLVSILATFKSVDLVTIVLNTLKNVMPQDAFSLIGKEMQRILADSSTGLLTFGALGTIWAASSGIVSLLGSLNTAYDVKEERGFFHLRLIAIGLTFALALLIIVGSVLLIGGDQISRWLEDVTHWSWMSTVGAIINYVLGLGLMFLGLELIFYFGPNVKNQKWRWISPGSLLAVIIFVASSFGFSLYIHFGGGYSATYGSLGGVIVLMLWLYLLGVAIMLGGEVNSEIAAAAKAHGNADAPNVPPSYSSAARNKRKPSGRPSLS